jgi:hypothetical protein
VSAKGRGAIAVIVLLVLAGAAFVLLRGDGDSAQLRAMRADPIAAYSPPGARLLRTHATPERAGGSFLKPQEAWYQRLFAVPEGAGGVRALRAVAEAARAAGWEISGGIPERSVRANKHLATGPARLTVVLAPEPDLDPTPTLSIALIHTRV